MNRDFGGIFRLKGRKSYGVSKRGSRANGIVAPMSVAHADDEDAVSGSEVDPNMWSYHDEKVFPNGDLYTGQWLDNLPHGHGKYLWNDGCMYVGEWCKGKNMGKGVFSWPCGATYEGEFNNGYMDGKGTYTGLNGDSYRGFWVMNLRHGQGTKSFANGDYYEGEWKRGMQEGQGRYQWKNGNVYVGEWRNGMINGSGVLTWVNGNKFDGLWEAGVPKGEGVYRWVDGSSYDGFWSSDPSEQSGNYCPVEGSSAHEDFEWEPMNVYFNDLSDCQISPVEKITLYPSQKIVNGQFNPRHLNSTKSKSNGRRTNGISQVSDHDAAANGENIQFGGFRESHPVLLPETVKKQGVTICKGHKNYELMLNLQLGIRHSVGRPGPAINLDLKPSAFDPKEKVWTRFPPEGSKHTPPHPSCEFKWKDYCPKVFRTLRKLFKVDPADYMLSICGNDALRELSSPGKSGSFFYLTHDDKYMIKTMKKSEVKVLLKMLPAYFNHVKTFEDTLVTRFYGLHCVKMTGPTQKKVRFVVMGNLFFTGYTIHRRFDLKGSSHGRTTDKPESEIDPTITLKDLDLNYIFRLQSFWFQEFCRQVDRDCDFLEQEKIMDYSLLVGMHFQNTSAKPVVIANGKTDMKTIAPRLSRVNETEKLVFDQAQWETIRLGINMPARAEVTTRKTDCEAQFIGEPTGECYDVLICFGIIDILQDYDISKKLEHAYKSFHYDGASISAVDPKQYSKRFRDFIYKVFAEDS